MFQIDPIASVIALVALAISIWAIVVAKRAPLRERTRANRDLLRTALRSAVDGLETLTAAIRRGEDIPELPGAVSGARSTLSEIAPRLKERATLAAIDNQLDSVHAAVVLVRVQESGVASSQENLAFWREQAETSPVDSVKATAAEQVRAGEARLARDDRARDAGRIELKAVADRARAGIRTYLASLDAYDRNEKDPK